MGIEIEIDPLLEDAQPSGTPLTIDQAANQIQGYLTNPSLFNVQVPANYEFSLYEFSRLIAESLPENLLNPTDLLLLDYRYFADQAVQQNGVPEQIKSFLVEQDVSAQINEGLINQYAGVTGMQPDIIRDQWASLAPPPVRLQFAPNAAMQQQAAPEMGGAGSFFNVEDYMALAGMEQSRAYSDDDFVQLFQFDSNWQNAWNIFMAQQQKGYFPSEDAEAEQVPLYKFNWDVAPPDPASRMGEDAQRGPAGVLGIRNRVRNMSPEELQVLITKMHMAGIFEDIGGYPDRAYSGSDQFVQLGLDRIMALSIEQGGIGLEEVLRRRTDQRAGVLTEQVQNANISVVQETLRSIGVNILGRPLTQEESLQVLASLEELSPEFAEAQLGKGVSMEEIIADIETVDEEEMLTYSRLVEDMFKQQAGNFRAYNRTRSIGDYLRTRDRGGSAAADVGYAPSAFEASVETVADIQGAVDNG